MPIAYTELLTQYLETGILKHMLNQGYALYPAKSAGYAGRRGTDYHVDMSIRTHVINGLFPVTRLLVYLAEKGIYSMPERDYRKLIALFTTHDFHKDPNVQDFKERGEFDVPLTEVEREIAALGISDWVDTTAAEHRGTMIHSPSPKVGDYSEAESGASKLEPWIHIADSLSSMQTVRDYSTVNNYLRKIMTRQYARQPWTFYWHELDDYRGVSTLLLHQAVSTVLEEYGLYPLLYFPNGVLYIGPTMNLEDFGDLRVLRKRMGEIFFQHIQDSLADKALSVAERAIRAPQGTTKFAVDAFIFADIERLILALRNRTQRTHAKTFLTERLGKRLAGQKKRSGRTISEGEIKSAVTKFCEAFQIATEAENDDDFSNKWAAVSSFVMGVDNIATVLLGEKAVDEWLFNYFHTPPDIAQIIASKKKELTSGGIADHALVVAYHYLQVHRFGDDKRSADETDIVTIFSELQTQSAMALKPHDSAAQRLAYVNTEFGLQTDIATYLNEHLTLSFAPSREISSPLALIGKARSYSHGRICSFCNREIPTEMKSKNRQITMADIVTTTFSNRRLPSGEERQAPMQVWCPMCYLEFMLRQRMGLGYSQGYDKSSSDRLYLFLLPDYSFTPEFWQFARRRLFQPFESVTKLKVRRNFGDGADAPTIPNRWLLHGDVDDQLLDEVQRLFEKTAQEMAAINEKSGRPIRELLGEKMKVAPIRSPNFQILVYENSVSKQYKDRAPTRSEMWAKATYAATLIHLLLGVRVYVTDRPYLPLSRPDEMKHIIELDGAHSLLRNVLPRSSETKAPRGTVIALADLKEAIDLLSAVWEVNAALSGGRSNLDKQVATVLEQVNVEPLAGAGFYKRRQADGYVVYPALLRACELLLNLQGGVKLNLAQKLTDVSLKLFIPLGRKEGKAHRYETMFRTAVEVVKTSPRSISDEELETRVAGNLLKRLNRIGGGAVPLYGEALARAAADFARLVVQDLFRARCRGSAAQLTHEENALADAIYYLTDRQIGNVWKQHKAEKTARETEEKKNAH